MPARSFTVELTKDQARIVAEIAEADGMQPNALLIEAIGHGLPMIVAGVNDDDLVEPCDRPEPPQSGSAGARCPADGREV